MVHITAGLPRIYMPVIVSVEYSGDLSPHKDCGGFVCCGLSLVIHTSEERQRTCRTATRRDAMEDHIGWSSL